jgi:hypothetical protein
MPAPVHQVEERTRLPDALGRHNLDRLVAAVEAEDEELAGHGSRTAKSPRCDAQ